MELILNIALVVIGLLFFLGFFKSIDLSEKL
jgi:hypothetical protein